MREQGRDLRLEINAYADMSYEDFIAVRGGFKGIKGNTGTFKKVFYSGAELESSVDWREKTGILAPVQDQGQCGSCWAFSATCALESGYAIYKKSTIKKLSEQELVDCESMDQGCNGGLMDHAFSWVEKHGMTTESKIP
jgi:KDEL-tailed cysteine endopeptidase